MDQAHRNAIQRNIQCLMNVNLVPLSQELIQRGVIDPAFVQRVKVNYKLPEEQAQEFFLSYTKRGPEAFQVLIDTLFKIGHITEAQALSPNQISNGAVSSTTGDNFPPRQHVANGIGSSRPTSPTSTTSQSVPSSPYNLRSRTSRVEPLSSTTGDKFPPRQHVANGNGSSSSNSSTSSTSKSVPTSPYNLRSRILRGEPLSSHTSPSGSASSLSGADQLMSAMSSCSMEDRPPLVIHVRKAEEYNMGKLSKDEAYPMLTNPRGFALIINNINFLGDPSAQRDGAEKDSENLKQLLEQLGFRVTIRHNVSKAELIDADGHIEKFLKQFEEQYVNACVVAVMSHGKEGLIRTSDPENSGNPYSNYWNIHKDIVSKFNNRYCPKLIGKPKIFIIQACQGENKDRGVRRTQTDGRDLTAETKQISNFSPTSVLEGIPETEDMVVCMSTVPGFVSNRDIEHGTWYIRTLCEVFMESAWNTELIVLLRMVGRRMREIQSEYGHKQMSSYQDLGLHYSVFFNPGFNSPDVTSAR